jgi:ubiquinone/menaquinone biosynthesis C-methylase UbiE
MKHFQRRVAKQLADPSGLMGAVVARRLNERNRKAITCAVAALDCTGAETVADIGFGGGIGLELLMDAVGSGGVVHGIEPSSSMIHRARKALASDVARGDLVLHMATMDQLPLGDESLDGWISLNTIYFIPDLAASFAELARVLAPTGRGVLGVADPQWLGQQPFAEHGFTVRPIDHVVAALSTAGLAVVAKNIEDPHSGAGYNLLVCSHPVQNAGR